ncbi:MAG: DUF927 domain-containing protein [Magnetococcales bacterium]|nr:DUF927 domain-containing protein [Magnetococcales bacterium]
MESALFTISADCDRDTWARVAMALKSELDEGGFPLFDSWSRTGASYDSQAAIDTWKSVRPGGGITIKTLFGMARDAGWTWTSRTPPAPRPAPSAKTTPAKDPWKPITPVPIDAPALPNHYRLGKPSRCWAYRDHAGQTLFHVCRFDKSDGGKEIIPLTFCQGPEGERQWRWKSMPAPRPLYGLDRLADKPDALAIVLEGEKAADAAPSLFPDWVGITSPNGCASAGQADWSPLAGRHVILWPDADEAGLKYADRVTAELRKIGAASVRWLRLEAFLNLPGLPTRERLPEGWDAADAVTEGADQATGESLLADPANLIQPRQEHEAGMAEFLKQQEEARARETAFRSEEEERRKFPFQVMERTKGRRNGVYFFPPSDGDAPPEPVWICSPLHVTARTRDAFQGNHGRLLEFDDPDGHHHTWSMPMSLLAGDGAELRSTLLSKGLELSTARKARDLLADYLQRARPAVVATCVERVGWHGGAFVLPDQTIGAVSERILLQTGEFEQTGFEMSGTLEDWQREVAAKCAGNSRLVFAVSAAFAAGLLHLVGDESGGFNFTGQSSSGKTTALTAAVSVWGGPGRLQRWRATANGLESLAAIHNDTLLCLDELAQVSPQEAGEIAYLLANGTGKARSNRDGSARRKAAWRLLFLSAGEIGLSEHMRTVGKTARAGQEVRLADIPADTGAGHGLFENLHGCRDGAEFSRVVNQAARSFHGTPARAFISGLVANLDRASSDIDTARRDFMAEVMPHTADGQVHRVAGRFALVAAAGELATAMGVTGWQPGEAFRAAKTCLESWMSLRGGAGPQEARTALAQVRLFFEQHGDSRFANKRGGNDRPIINRAGFREIREEGIGHMEYFVLPEVFKTEICKGLDARFVTRLLIEQGWIAPGPDGVATIKPRLPDMGPTRCYHFVSLGGGDED